MTRLTGFGAVALSCFALTACAMMNKAPQRVSTASPPPDVYVVFFDGKSASLTPAGLDIVDHAATAAKSQPRKMVQITGPSTQIVPGYNPNMAEPRMRAVEARLAADGVDKSRLVQTSLPTSKLMVDLTGARRVEIRLVDKPS